MTDEIAAVDAALEAERNMGARQRLLKKRWKLSLAAKVQQETHSPPSGETTPPSAARQLGGAKSSVAKASVAVSSIAESPPPAKPPLASKPPAEGEPQAAVNGSPPPEQDSLPKRKRVGKLKKVPAV